jgi:hypothetical protein
VQCLSNIKRLDIEETIRTVLEKNPKIRAKFLVRKVMEKTGKSRSTIYEHLCSLVTRREIYSKKGFYYLEPPEGAERRAKEKHTKEIVSGLLDLAGRGRYTAPGGIVPDSSFAKYAHQHLNSAYSSIHYLENSRDMETKEIFRERCQKLAEALKLGDEKLKGFCEKCERKV